MLLLKVWMIGWLLHTFWASIQQYWIERQLTLLCFIMYSVTFALLATPILDIHCWMWTGSYTFILSKTISAPHSVSLICQSDSTLTRKFANSFSFHASLNVKVWHSSCHLKIHNSQAICTPCSWKMHRLDMVPATPPPCSKFLLLCWAFEEILLTS